MRNLALRSPLCEHASSLTRSALHPPWGSKGKSPGRTTSPAFSTFFLSPEAVVHFTILFFFSVLSCVAGCSAARRASFCYACCCRSPRSTRIAFQRRLSSLSTAFTAQRACFLCRCLIGVSPLSLVSSFPQLRRRSYLFRCCRVSPDAFFLSFFSML